MAKKQVNIRIDVTFEIDENIPAHELYVENCEKIKLCRMDGSKEVPVKGKFVFHETVEVFDENSEEEP
jgi:hypothetical protein